jgi:diacylglycerol kinase (ATP)
MQKVRFIVNPISGLNRNPKKIIRWIEEIFGTSSIQFEIVYTKGPGDGTIIAQKSKELGFEMVVAIGGDGTINEIGRGLFHSDVIMGVVPAGSGNGFARNFKIPLNQKQAIWMLLNPKILTIDVGTINNHHFFNVAGIGLDAEISHNFDQFGIRGPLPYFFIGTKAFMSYNPDPVKLIMEEKELVSTPLLLSIANAPEYGNGAIIAPTAKPDDGILNLSILENLSFWKAAPNLYRLFNGTIAQIEGFHSYEIKSMIIERCRAGIIHTDGNPHQDEAILRVGILEKALKVVVGADYN